MQKLKFVTLYYDEKAPNLIKITFTQKLEKKKINNFQRIYSKGTFKGLFKE